MHDAAGGDDARRIIWCAAAAAAQRFLLIYPTYLVGRYLNIGAVVNLARSAAFDLMGRFTMEESDYNTFAVKTDLTEL